MRKMPPTADGLNNGRKATGKNKMLPKIEIGYGIVALVTFIFLVLLGKVFKRISLGNGVSVGVLNALLLSICWPITYLCSIVGWICECIKTWNRL